LENLNKVDGAVASIRKQQTDKLNHRLRIEQLLKLMEEDERFKIDI